MKKTDIAMIILIASVSVLASYAVMNSLPVFKEANKPQSVPKATAVESNVAEVDKTVFNEQAVNPTVEVIIGESGS